MNNKGNEHIKHNILSSLEWLIANMRNISEIEKLEKAKKIIENVNVWWHT